MSFEDELSKELEGPLLLQKQDIEIPRKEVKKIDTDTKKQHFSKVIDFTNRIKKSYGDLVKSVLIFGSAARGDMKKTSDVDVWVVIDDTATKSSEDIIKIRSQLQLIAKETKGLHIQMNGLTEFWGWMKMGSPELFNYLRVGLVIYDTGFIKPVQRMLKLGLLPPSKETVTLKAKSADTIVKRVKLGMKTMVFDLRYAATDACQSVVMHFYKKTPDQRQMPEFLEKLVKGKKLDKAYIEKFNELNTLWKDIDHGRIKDVEPKHLNKAMSLTTDIIETMKTLLPEELRNTDKFMI